MKKIILTALATVLLVSCRENGTPVVTTDTDNYYKVVKLFDVDGISVYRFYDGDNYVYFTNSNGRVQSTSTNSFYDPATKTMKTENKTIETICNNNDSL